MILKTDQDKINFLKKCKEHIERISLDQTNFVDNITQGKITVLSAIYEKTSKLYLNNGDIDLDEIYKNVKREVSHSLPDQQINVDTLMNTHRGWLFNTLFGYLLSLIWPSPKSTVFLKETGFFNVQEKVVVTNFHDDFDKSNIDCNEEFNDVDPLKPEDKIKAQDYSNFKINIESTSTLTESTESKKNKASRLIALSYRHYKRMKTTPSLKIEEYPNHLIPKFRNQQIVNDEKYEQYAQLFEDQEEQRVVKLMKNYISRITFDKFINQLDICMNRLDKYMTFHVDNQTPILLINDKGHSQEWVNQLAQPRLKHAYQTRIEMINISHPPNFDSEEVLKAIVTQLNQHKTVTHLYIDDCAYSGTQLSSYIQKILLEFIINKNFSQITGTINFIFVIPYMKKNAVNILFNIFEQYQKSIPNVTLNFKLINTGVICPIKDLPIKDHDKNIFLNAIKTLDLKPLVIADWKIPDYISFPHFFSSGITPGTIRENKEGVRFLPKDLDSPYKRL